LKPFVLLDKRFYAILEEIVKFRAEADDVNWSNIPAEIKKDLHQMSKPLVYRINKRHLKETSHTIMVIFYGENCYNRNKQFPAGFFGKYPGQKTSH